MARPDKKAFLLRVDPALWAEIERLAQAELRSVNGQVEYLLRDALAKRGIRADGAHAGRAPAPGAPAKENPGRGPGDRAGP
ncbi:MAG: hypothetical protein MUE39_09815 [Gammaproteobacteria bacterium]|jgi:hypothetical protein|nr:hypothetical protein [Gammaproteobacteria bacterium]